MPGYESSDGLIEYWRKLAELAEESREAQGYRGKISYRSGEIERAKRALSEGESYLDEENVSMKKSSL